MDFTEKQKDNAVRFEQNYSFDGHRKELNFLLKDLGIVRKKLPQLDKLLLRSICANLLFARSVILPVKISLNASDYKIINRYDNVKRTYLRFADLIKALDRENYILLLGGYHDMENNYYNRQTRIAATDNLIQLFSDVCLKVEPKKEIIILRDRKGRLLDYKDNKQTNRMRRELKKYNSFKNKFEIKFKIHPKELDLNLKRLIITNRISFSSKIELNSDFSIQNKNILIHNPNENPVKNKIKSKSINPVYKSSPGTGSFTTNRDSNSKKSVFVNHNDNLSYQLFVRKNDDSYRIFNRGKFSFGGRFYGSVIQSLSSKIRKTITIDGEETVELDYSGMQIRMLYHKIGIDYKNECYVYPKTDLKHKNQRRLMKLTALIAINAKSRTSALAALGLKIKEEKLILPKTDKALVKLYEKFVEYHNPIKRFIASDIGIELMAVDSEIMGNILKKLTAQDILGLTRALWLSLVCLNPMYLICIIDVSYKNSQRKAES